MEKLINKWHSYLDMPKNDLAWHEQDILDEFNELKEAKGVIDTWSEISDIVYTYTRARWSGHKNLKFPIHKLYFLIGIVYMFPKYTLRWRFYYILGKRIDKKLELREVRNPKKIEKLKVIAEKYNIDKEILINEAKKLKKKWIFLK